MLKTTDLYDFSHTYKEAADFLQGKEYPFQALPGIKALILEIGAALPVEEFDHPAADVWIAKDAVVFPSAYIAGPCIIGHRTEIRQCAFIRGSALIGEDCVVGNSTELKNVILFDRVQVPHFNYVGDSVLGYRAHMGAGAVTSNVKSDKKDILIKDGTETMETGLHKIGAFLGDRVEVGCNSVLNPGTVIGRDSNIYPTSCVRGTVPANSIWKRDGEIVEKF